MNMTIIHYDQVAEEKQVRRLSEQEDGVIWSMLFFHIPLQEVQKKRMSYMRDPCNLLLWRDWGDDDR